MKKLLLFILATTIQASILNANPPCIDPDIPFLSANNDTICERNSTVISIASSDSLHDASVWVLYSGTCGGTFIDSNITGSFIVSPTVSTTYFIRGEGSCITSGICGTVIINVNPAPSTFSITSGASTICKGDSTLLFSPSSELTNCWHEPNIESWVNVGNPDFSLVNSDYHDIAINPITGEPYIVFVNYATPWYKVNIMKYDGIDWVFVGYSTMPTTGKFTKILFHPTTNEPYIVFQDYNAGGKTSVMKFDGNSWSYVGGPGFSSKLAMDQALKFHPVTNDPYVAYRDIYSASFNDGGQATVMRFDGSNWTSVGSQMFTSGYAYTLDFDINPVTFEPYIAYSGGSSQLLGQTHVLKYNGSSWIYVGSPFDAGHPGCTKEQSISFHPILGDAYVAFRNGINNISVMKFDGTNWGIVGVTDIATNISYQPSIKFHPLTHYPYLSFSNLATGRNVVKFDGANWGYVGNSGFSTVYNYAKNLVFHPLTMEPYVAFGKTSGKATVMKYNSKCFGNEDTVYVYVAGNYEFTITNSFGCSTTSSNQIVINVNPTFLNSQNDTICLGDSTLLYGIYQSTAGVYYDSLQTINGCDSILSTTLTINPVFITNQNTSICAGDSILLYGIYQNAAGVYYDSLQTINGCDSVLSTTLSINPVFSTYQNVSICQGDSILLNGTYQNTAGTYYDSLQTINGCDSVLSTTLTVNPIFSSNQNDTTCQGDSLLIYGIYHNTAGVYYDSLQTINGCDSILSTTLTVNPIFSSNQNDAICQGDSLLIYGSYQNTAGIYYDSLQTIYGCDSLFSTTLTVNPLPNVTLASFNPDTLCITASAITLPTGSPTGGNYSGNGVIGGNFDPSSAGIGSHNIIYTYSDGNTCTNSDTTLITVEICSGIDNISTDFGIIIYPNPSTGQFTIEKPNDLNKEVQVKLLDATSKLILEKVIPIGKQKVEMDIINYSRGVYYLQLIVEDEVFVKQILKN